MLDERSANRLLVLFMHRYVGMGKKFVLTEADLNPINADQPILYFTTEQDFNTLGTKLTLELITREEARRREAQGVPLERLPNG